MTIQTRIYNSEVSTPFGIFNVAVDEASEYDAKLSIRNVIQSELGNHYALCSVRKVWKSNRRIIEDMDPIKKTDWAWIKKISN